MRLAERVFSRERIDTQGRRALEKVYERGYATPRQVVVLIAHVLPRQQQRGVDTGADVRAAYNIPGFLAPLSESDPTSERRDESRSNVAVAAEDQAERGQETEAWAVCRGALEGEALRALISREVREVVGESPRPIQVAEFMLRWADSIQGPAEGTAFLASRGVELGDRVWVRDLQQRDILCYDIVSSVSDVGHLGGSVIAVSVAGPIGKALVGARVGEECSYQLPGRPRREIRIVLLRPRGED